MKNQRVKYFYFQGNRQTEFERTDCKPLLDMPSRTHKTKYFSSIKAASPSDMATICYTSGTTGNPKGAILSHGNFIASEAGIFDRVNVVRVFSRFERVCFLVLIPIFLIKPHLSYIGANRCSPRPVAISYLPLGEFSINNRTVKIQIRHIKPII